MAKRASPLDHTYNPISAKLEDFNNPHPKQGEDEKLTVSSTQPVGAEIIRDEEEKLLIKENVKTFDKELSLISEAKRTELKFVCSLSEREQLHDFAYKITGRRNTLSNVMRSFLVLLQYAEQEIEGLSESIHAIKAPPRSDRLQSALYEKKIASVLWQAIKRTKSTGR